MLIASRQKLSQFTESPSLTIKENAIEQVTSAKSLVDQNINWECHIENISKKIACAIGVIKRIQHLTPFNFRIPYLQLPNRPLHNLWCLCMGKLCLDISKKDRKSTKTGPPPYLF